MILKKLKEATKVQHERLESIVNLVDENLSMENYKQTLLRFYRFYDAIEPKLAKFELENFGYHLSKRRRLPLLKTDLQKLGATRELEDIPKWQGLPSLDTIGEAFGSLYVIEGSSLGGQVILRHLKTRLGLDSENGASFFDIYGSETGKMWKEFGEIITRFSEDYKNDDEIIKGAVETFDGFSACFLDESMKKLISLSYEVLK